MSDKHFGHFAETYIKKICAAHETWTGLKQNFSYGEFYCTHKVFQNRPPENNKFNQVYVSNSGSARVQYIEGGKMEFVFFLSL